MKEVNVFDFLLSLWRHKRIVGGVAFAVLVAAGLFTMLVVPRSYLASTTMVMNLNSDTRSGLSLLGSSSNPLATMSLLSLSRPQSQWTYMTILKSLAVSRAVCRELGLKERFNQPTELHAALQLQKIVELSFTKTGALRIEVTTRGTPRGFLPRPDDDAAARKLAADIANAYPKALDKWLSEHNIDASARRLDFLKKKVAETKQRLDAAEIALKEYKQKHNVVEISEQAKQAILEYGDLSRSLAAAEVERQAVDASLRTVEAQLQAEAVQPVEKLPPTTQTETQLWAGLAEARRELRAAQEVYEDTHPEVQRLQSEVDALQKQYEKARQQKASEIAGGFENTIEQLRQQSVAAQARATLYRSKLSDLERRLGEMPARELEYVQLLRDATVQRQIYEVLEGEYYRRQALEGDTGSRFTVVDEAYVPITRDKPKLRYSLGAGLLIGLFLGIALAAWRERNDRRAMGGPLPEALSSTGATTAGDDQPQASTSGRVDQQ